MAITPEQAKKARDTKNEGTAKALEERIDKYLSEREPTAGGEWWVAIDHVDTAVAEQVMAKYHAYWNVRIHSDSREGRCLVFTSRSTRDNRFDYWDR